MDDVMDHIKSFDRFQESQESEYFLTAEELANSTIDKILRNNFHDPLISSESDEETDSPKFDWNEIFKKKKCGNADSGSASSVREESSSTFSSLSALVDNHLSKTHLQESHSENTANGLINHIQIPSLTGAQNGTQSEKQIAFNSVRRLNLPTFNLKENPIKNLLAEQLANTLKARELKRQEEEAQQKMEEEMKKLKMEEEENDFVIDLTQALQTSYVPDPPPSSKEQLLSNSSSMESLFEANFIDCDNEIEERVTPESMLPCITDMSYILFEKVPHGRCSEFGKVLTSRLRPFAAPYLRENIKSKVQRFTFDTMSPCDIIKMKLRRPTTYSFSNDNK